MNHHRQRRLSWFHYLFATVAVTNLSVLGSVYAFPLWIVQFKRKFMISQTQANFIGVALYMGAPLIGMQVAPVLIPRRMHLANACSSLGQLSGFLLLYLAGDDYIGAGTAAYVAVLMSIILIMASLGLVFALIFCILLRDDFFGMPNLVLVNGVCSTGFAIGGVAAGALWHWTDLGLSGNLLVLFVSNAVTATANFVVVWKQLVHMAVSASPIYEDENDEALLPVSEVINDKVVAPDDEVEELEEPEKLVPWLALTLQDWRYWHTLLIIVMIVGVGATFTTNIGSVVTSTLPMDTPQDVLQKKISMSVIYLNISQLVGRVLYTTLSACGGNPNLKTMIAALIVSIGYIACCVSRVYFSFTETNVFINSCAFGFLYGVMWCVNNATVSFLPLTKNIPRVMSVTQPVALVGIFTMNFIAGKFYDMHTLPGSNECYGRDCYYTSDLTMTGISVILFGSISLRLWLRVPDRLGRWPKMKRRKQGRNDNVAIERAALLVN